MFQVQTFPWNFYFFSPHKNGPEFFIWLWYWTSLFEFYNHWLQEKGVISERQKSTDLSHISERRHSHLFTKIGSCTNISLTCLIFVAPIKTYLSFDYDWSWLVPNLLFWYFRHIYNMLTSPCWWNWGTFEIERMLKAFHPHRETSKQAVIQPILINFLLVYWGHFKPFKPKVGGSNENLRYWELNIFI